MRHVTIIQDHDDSITLNEKIDMWIKDNEEEILEIIDIDWQKVGSFYMATVTYQERN